MIVIKKKTLNLTATYGLLQCLTNLTNEDTCLLIQHSAYSHLWDSAIDHQWLNTVQRAPRYSDTCPKMEVSMEFFGLALIRFLGVKWKRESICVLRKCWMWRGLWKCAVSFVIRQSGRTCWTCRKLEFPFAREWVELRKLLTFKALIMLIGVLYPCLTFTWWAAVCWWYGCTLIFNRDGPFLWQNVSVEKWLIRVDTHLHRNACDIAIMTNGRLKGTKT